MLPSLHSTLKRSFPLEEVHSDIFTLFLPREQKERLSTIASLRLVCRKVKGKVEKVWRRLLLSPLRSGDLWSFIIRKVEKGEKRISLFQKDSDYKGELSIYQNDTPKGYSIHSLSPNIRVWKKKSKVKEARKLYLERLKKDPSLQLSTRFLPYRDEIDCYIHRGLSMKEATKLVARQLNKELKDLCGYSLRDLHTRSQELANLLFPIPQPPLFQQDDFGLYTTLHRRLGFRYCYWNRHAQFIQMCERVVSDLTTLYTLETN